MQLRVDDYARLGVENIWIVNQWNRVGYYASEEGFRKTDNDLLEVAGTEIRVSLTEVFGELQKRGWRGGRLLCRSQSPDF